jgi:hypothetical protein
LSTNSAYFKVIARLRSNSMYGGSSFRLIDVRTGDYIDTTLQYIFSSIGSQLFAGRCFIPTAVDFPVIWTDDGDRYQLPVVEPRTGECYQHDRVIILFELVQNGAVVGYEVTDYQGGLTQLSLQEALGYESVGFWNAVIEGCGIKPLGKYVFPRKSV